MGFWKDKNVLITGINGFVASSLASNLLKEGANVVGTLRDEAFYDKAKYFFSPDMPGKIRFAKGDIKDYDFISRLMSGNEIEYVFHLAACSTVRIASRNPMECFETNIRGTYTICEAIRNCPTVEGAVVAASDKAYGVSQELPYKETTPLNGLYTYDASKACTDIVARSYAINYNLPITVLRCSNIYGPGDLNLTRIIPNTIRRLMAGEAPILWNETSTQQREFTYIDDIVEAYKIVVQYSNKTREVAFNVGTGIPVVVKDFMDTILKAYSNVTGEDFIPAEVKQKESTFKEIPCQFLDVSKIGLLLGFNCNMSLEKGLEETVNWYINFFNKEGY